MNLSYQNYYVLFWVLLGVAALLLILAVFLFFYLDIPKVFSDLSGRKQKKEIERLSDSQAVSDELDSAKLSQLERSLNTSPEALDSTSVRLDKKAAIRGEKAKVLDSSMQSDVFSKRRDSEVDVSALATTKGESAQLADGSKYNPDLFEIINLNGDKDISEELLDEIQALDIGETEALVQQINETEALSQEDKFRMTSALSEVNLNETSRLQNSIPQQHRSETVKLSDYEVADNNANSGAWLEVEEEISLGSSGQGII